MSVESIELNIDHTLKVLKNLNKFFKRKNKNNISLELKRCINYIMEKDFMTNIDMIISFDATTITLCGDKDILDEFIIVDYSISGNNNKLFAPLIYYIFPDIQCCGRMIVHKKDNNIIKYLIHRSNFNEHPSEHPGGHIEYIEFGKPKDTDNHIENNKIIHSGKKYVEVFLQKMNMSLKSVKTVKRQKECLVNIKKNTLQNSNIIRWILYGTCREVYEEAGLDISNLISNIDLIKIGTKTHYFSVMIDNNITESGPQDKFKSEVYITTNISDCVTNNTNNKRSTKPTLDEFWHLRKNNTTHHAWITNDEMKMYWNQRYRSHIEDVISIISHV